MTSDTSVLAYERIKARVRHRMLDDLRALLNQHFLKGLTCDEVEMLTGWSHQTASARMSDLAIGRRKRWRWGDAAPTGVFVAPVPETEKVEKRKTRSGRAAWAWRLKRDDKP